MSYTEAVDEIHQQGRKDDHTAVVRIAVVRKTTEGEGRRKTGSGIRHPSHRITTTSKR